MYREIPNSNFILENLKIRPQEPLNLTTLNQKIQRANFDYKIRHQVHDEQRKIGNLTYDIPSDGGLNIVLNVENTTGDSLPLAALSLNIQDGIPTINMLQRVQAWTEESPPDEVFDDNFKVLAMLEQVDHPLKHLQHGNERLAWAKILLLEAERISRENGFEQLRIKSGFENPHISFTYSLSMSVQQYDLTINELAGWNPLDQEGNIIDSEDRLILSKILKKLRDKKIKTKEEIHSLYPGVKLPVFWCKNLVSE